MIDIFPSSKHLMTSFSLPSPVVYGYFQREFTYLLSMLYCYKRQRQNCPCPGRRMNRVEESLHSFVTSRIDGFSGHLHTPATLPPGRNRITHWIRGWLGSGVGLDVLEKSTFALVGIQTPDRPSRSQITISTAPFWPPYCYKTPERCEFTSIYV